jgi:condensin complex subunit 3
MLAHEGLAERLIDPCLDVLAKISPTERELIRVVVEVVIELRDDGNGNESEGDVDLSVSFSRFSCFHCHRCQK